MLFLAQDSEYLKIESETPFKGCLLSKHVWYLMALASLASPEDVNTQEEKQINKDEYDRYKKAMIPVLECGSLRGSSETQPLPPSGPLS